MGVAGVPHPHVGVSEPHRHWGTGEHINVQHNVEQPKGPHIPLPAQVSHTGHPTPSVHSHHSHNGMTHTPVQHLPTGNHHTSTHHSTGHHGGNHTNHHHGHTGHHTSHSHKK